MPFNPNEPQNGEIIDADFLRNQFNAIKALNDDLVAIVGALAARIAALEASAVDLAAIGFGEAGACGKLTVIGTFAGKPMYQAAGGWWYCWNDAGGMWICRDALPGTGDLSNNRYADLGYAEDITAVQWTTGFNPGMLPCGSVVAA